MGGGPGGDNPFPYEERPLDADAARAPSAPRDPNAPESVAPDVEPNRVNLGRLRQALQNPEELRSLERDTGLTRQDLEQFVKASEALPERGVARPGRDIATTPTPEAEPVLDPNRRVEGPGAIGSSRASRAGGATPGDEVRGMTQGYASKAPAALQSRLRAYRDSVSRSPSAAPAASGSAPATPPPPSPANNPRP